MRDRQLASRAPPTGTLRRENLRQLVTRKPWTPHESAKGEVYSVFNRENDAIDVDTQLFRHWAYIFLLSFYSSALAILFFVFGRSGCIGAALFRRGGYCRVTSERA